MAGSDDLSTMFDPESYSATREPLAQASTLPSHCYTSETFFHGECERVFASCWHFAGRVNEWTDAGDFRVVDTVAGSVLVCRGTDGVLRGFVNACRHRGTRLKDGSGRCHKVVCPYHSWVYDLQGRLQAARGMEEIKGFAHQDYGLLEVRLDSWGGFVFIDHSGAAPALREWLGDLPEFMEGHRPDHLKCVKRLDFTVDANWKFLIENALEAYHTGTVHRGTLGAQSSESVTTSGQWDALYVASDERNSIATLPGEPQVLPFIEGLSGKSLRGTWFTVIYPCTQLVFAQDCVWWLDFKPRTVSRTQVTLGACFPQSVALLPEFERRAAAYYERWSEATAEDNAIAEAQQRGHNAGGVGVGRFSIREHCVHRLDNWVLDRVLSPRRRP